MKVKVCAAQGCERTIPNREFVCSDCYAKIPLSELAKLELKDTPMEKLDKVMRNKEDESVE